MEMLTCPARVYDKDGDSIWYTGLVRAEEQLVTTLWIENPVRVLGRESFDNRPAWSPKAFSCVVDFEHEKGVVMRLVSGGSTELQFHGVLRLDLAGDTGLGEARAFHVRIPELDVSFTTSVRRE